MLLTVRKGPAAVVADGNGRPAMQKRHEAAATGSLAAEKSQNLM
jgi:hypothetical protein